MPVPIRRLARSIYEETGDAEMRRLFDALAHSVAEGDGWPARRRAMLDVLSLAARLAEDAGDVPEAANDESEALFLTLVPLVVGVVLERLGESTVDSVDQAAFYVLSAHPEHQEAADGWIRADRERLMAFRAFLRAEPDYRRLFEASAGFEQGLDLDRDPD
jgi:hypothetical protein